MSLHRIEYEGIAIIYNLHRKKVKNINLRINPKGEVWVSAGRNVPFFAIEAFVQKNAAWILRHLAAIEKRRQALPSDVLFDGKIVYYLGKPYTLRLRAGEEGVFRKEAEIWLFSPEDAQDHLRCIYLFWLKEQAVQKFAESMDKIYLLVEGYGIERPSIRIRNMKSLWGSCTPQKKQIRLNLQLMKADAACIEQVVLHELLHFRYSYHDTAFYAQMDCLMPDWRERKGWLESRYQDGIR